MDSCLRRNDGVGDGNDGVGWHEGYSQRNPSCRLSRAPAIMCVAAGRFANGPYVRVGWGVFSWQWLAGLANRDFRFLVS